MTFFLSPFLKLFHTIYSEETRLSACDERMKFHCRGIDAAKEDFYTRPCETIKNCMSCSEPGQLVAFIKHCVDHEDKILDKHPTVTCRVACLLPKVRTT